MLENNQNKLVLLKNLGMQYPVGTLKRKARYGLYKCRCGIEFETQMARVKNGTTQSCGCYKKERVTIHGLGSHRLYGVWNAIIQRCTNPNNKRYKDYGGRGITVCCEWMDVKNFIADMYPTYKEGLSIDRIDNDLGYSLENCRWATKEVQGSNTRLINSTNKSGYRGVCWDKSRNKWVAQIGIDCKNRGLGRFATALEAAIAYDKYVIDNNLEHTINGVVL